MKELHDILHAYDICQASGVQCALATVVRVEGSAYRGPGARMLISADGLIVGGISGGCLEKDVIRRAGSVFDSGKPTLVRYETTIDENGEIAFSLGCGGSIEVLTEPLDSQLVSLVKKLQIEGGTLETIITGDRMAEHAVGMDEVPKRARVEHRDLLDGAHDVFVEPIFSPLNLYIFGAGNDVAPLIHSARGLGWVTTVTDLRSGPMNLGRKIEPDQMIRCSLNEVREKVALASPAAAVIMTHNYNHDREILRWLADQSLNYLGLLGPRHRTDRILSEINPVPRILHSPVGLDLGAETPEEVAIAIVSEIIAVQHRRTGGKLTHHPGAIHDREQGEPCPAAAL